MNLLLDTCTFLWLTGAPEKLSHKALEALTNPGNSAFLSTASAWEISIKYGKGQLNLIKAPLIFVPEKCAAQGIKILEVDLDSALKTNDLPSIHKDPFDRILVCQAMNNDMTILTADPEIQRYPVKTLR